MFLSTKLNAKLGWVLNWRCSQIKGSFIHAELSEAQFCKGAIKYFITTCLSDIYIFHGKLVENIYLKNNPAPQPPFVPKW